MNKTVVITAKSGVHARPASLLVKKASDFQSEITIKRGNQIASAKSILNIMSLSLKHGDEIELSIEGGDAPEAMMAIVEMIENNFGE